MEKEIIKRWECGKDNLQKYLSTHKIEGNCESYKDLVRVLIVECLNYPPDCAKFSTDFVCVDDGHYQGTQLFILHYDLYQPDIEEYFMFDNDYGSCSGCDTLLSIIGYGLDSIPSPDMVKSLMTLCLHLVQRMKCVANLWKDTKNNH